MRQIKFRGRRLDNGKWIYGYLADGYYINDINAPVRTVIEVDSHTVGQFTGLLDRNGKEIYEGDIITLKENYPRVILWDKVSWALMPCKYYNDKYFWIMNLQHPGNDWWEKFAEEMEVAGNIHDNPKQLKPNEL